MTFLRFSAISTLLFTLIGTSLLNHAFASNRMDAFVTVDGDHFAFKGTRYSYLGTNLWSAMNLGSVGPGGDRARLVRELDRLKALGIDNLRIVAASEGPGTEPGRIVPALQNSPGVFDQNLLEGLDFALAEMSKRGMRAVMVLNNFWAWSGGMAQYVSWSTGQKIPYPPPFSQHSWDDFMAFSARFYSDEHAMAMANASLIKIVSRVNSITHRPYVADPSIMAWELGNEPRGMSNTTKFSAWIASTAHLIKSMDHNHLITTGTEGSLDGAGIDLLENNSSPDIDYATVHIWVQNFGWYDPAHASETYPVAVEKMKNYLGDQVSESSKLAKPLVLEEFGFSRDGNSYDPKSAVTLRDQYYNAILNESLEHAKDDKLAGVNFWAWAGEARPVGRPDSLWKVGDPFLGDPPHESQGWYSIYDSDTSTISILQNYTKQFSELK